MKLGCRRLPGLIFALLFFACPKYLAAQGRDKFEQIHGEELTFRLERDLSANYFKTDTSFGGIFSTGNVEQISVEGRSTTVYRVKRFKNEWDLGGYYNRKEFDANNPEDDPETIARYIYGTYRMDYFFTPDTTYFVGGGGYSDQVKGIPLGSRAFTGVAHYFIWNDQTALRLSGGYEFVGERRDPPDPKRLLHTAKVELGFQQQIGPTVLFTLNLGSLKAVNSLDEWLVNGEALFRIKLYKVLSLYTGISLRFDNVPTTGFRKLDTVTNFSLGVAFESPKPKKTPESQN